MFFYNHLYQPSVFGNLFLESGIRRYQRPCWLAAACKPFMTGWETIRMNDDNFLKDSRVSDPYVDRRSGDDRRQAYDSDYFDNGGLERRDHDDRRQAAERRSSCIRVSPWTSVCPE